MVLPRSILLASLELDRLAISRGGQAGRRGEWAHGHEIRGEGQGEGREECAENEQNQPDLGHGCRLPAVRSADLKPMVKKR